MVWVPLTSKLRRIPCLLNLWICDHYSSWTDDVVYGDVARDCLVANGTEESSKCSNTVSKKN